MTENHHESFLVAGTPEKPQGVAENGASRLVTQCNQILAHLRHSPITPLEALSLFGCFRLGARIFDLREQGYDITTEIVEVDSGARIAKYSLKGQLGLLS